MRQLPEIRIETAKPVDYFSAKEAVHRLEAVLSKHVIVPAGDEPIRPAGEHIVDLSPRETFADTIGHRRAALEKQLEELRFLEEVAELMRKYPGQFKETKA